MATELPAFDEETARLWVDAQFACTDYVEESTRALVAQSKGKLDPEAYAACLREALTDDELRDGRGGVADRCVGDAGGQQAGRRPGTLLDGRASRRSSS